MGASYLDPSHTKLTKVFREESLGTLRQGLRELIASSGMLLEKKRIHLFGIRHVFFKIVSAESVNAARLHLQKSCVNVSLPLAPQGNGRRPPSTVPTGLSDRQMSETLSGQSEPGI